MSPIYRQFILTPGADGWRYRHTELDIAGSCPSLIECVREIDELCEPPVMRMEPILAACAVMAIVYAAIWWGWGW